MMTLFDLLRFYYEMGDGMAWNPQALAATFLSAESARQFCDAAPATWTVRYLWAG